MRCSDHGSYVAGCEGCRAWMRWYQQQRRHGQPTRTRERPQRIDKPKRRTMRPDVSLSPADLPLEAYRAVAPSVVDNLICEFGEDAALRLLNGKPAPRREVVPFDRSLLAPPGAIAVRHGRRSHAEGAAVEAARWA